MKFRTNQLVLGLCLCLLIAIQARSGESVAGPETLCVMTFNLRYASQSRPNSWPERRPVMKACIEKYLPDLIGTQEGLYQQLKDIAHDLPQYTWLGTGRDGGSRGEFMAIFYKPDRFEPLEYDHFWLSDTPNVIASSTWGNTCRRMVTWIRFRDKRTNTEFYFWDTHLDHEVQLAREKGADLIRERVESLRTSLPVILAGDFNATAGANKAYDILVGSGLFQDLWLAARERRNEAINTFHGFNGPKQGGVRIDWILGRGIAEVVAAETVTFSQDGQFPSDHFPVIAWVKLAKPQ